MSVAHAKTARSLVVLLAVVGGLAGPGGRDFPGDFPGRIDHFAILCDLAIDLRPFGL